MKQTANLSVFIDAFQEADRTGCFSYAGKEALFNHLTEVDEDIELDIIALCCGYTEFIDIREFVEVYARGLPYNECPTCGHELPDSGYECEHCKESTIDPEVILDYLYDHTTVIRVDADGFIIMDY